MGSFAPPSARMRTLRRPFTPSLGTPAPVAEPEVVEDDFEEVVEAILNGEAIEASVEEEFAHRTMAPEALELPTPEPVEEPKAEEVSEDPEPVEEIEPDPAVEKPTWSPTMRKAELLAIALTLGLEVTEEMTKAQILSALDTVA